MIVGLIRCNSFGRNERNKNMASTQQTVIASPRIERLRDFVVAIGNLVETAARRARHPSRGIAPAEGIGRRR